MPVEPAYPFASPLKKGKRPGNKSIKKGIALGIYVSSLDARRLGADKINFE